MKLKHLIKNDNKLDLPCIIFFSLSLQLLLFTDQSEGPTSWCCCHLLSLLSYSSSSSTSGPVHAFSFFFVFFSFLSPCGSSPLIRSCPPASLLHSPAIIPPSVCARSPVRTRAPHPSGSERCVSPPLWGLRLELGEVAGQRWRKRGGTAGEWGTGAEAVQCVRDGLPCTLSACRWWITPAVRCQRERVRLSHDSPGPSLLLHGCCNRWESCGGFQVSCHHHSDDLSDIRPVVFTSSQATAALF